MRALTLGICLLAAGLAAAPKQVSSYLRVLKSTPIQHGASVNSAVEATALKGQVYAVVDEKLFNGFYKIDYLNHVSFINADAVAWLDDKGTPVPTVEPTREATLAPHPTLGQGQGDLGDEDEPHATSVPTVAPSQASTAAPTQVRTEIPTKVPTLKATVVPSSVPTWAPTPIPARIPTALPTAVPARLPTQVPKPITPALARGKRRVTPVPAQAVPRRSYGAQPTAFSASNLAFSGAAGGGLSIQREAGHMDRWELVLPMGAGKHETLVQPPYKRTAAMADQRPVEFSGFVGLGLEYRVARPLRLDFDWVAHSHRTQAADLGLPATKVGVPGVPFTTLFDESDAWYRMNAHQFQLALKLSLPFARVEPWVSGGYGAWVWSAELSDLHREIIYGEDSGVAWGGTLGVGIDFHGSFGGGLGWTLTPFVEWGAPNVNPLFKDIASLGVDWRDDFGTPAAVPARAGLQFGVGF